MPHEGQTGVYFESDGYRLLGMLFMAQGDEPKPTVVLLHGMPGIEKNADIALALRDKGWNCLIFHYRGCWDSEGVWTMKTLPDDVIAALDYLGSGSHPQVDMDKLVLIGHSMGGYAALLAAARDERPKAVAVIGAVTDPRALMWSDAEIEAEFTPWLPGLEVAGFKEQWAGLDAIFAPVEHVQRIAPRPLLIIHAEEDRAVPIEQARMLANRADDPVHLITHMEANHSFTWHRAWLQEFLLRWLDHLDLAL